MSFGKETRKLEPSSEIPKEIRARFEIEDRKPEERAIVVDPRRSELEDKSRFGSKEFIKSFLNKLSKFVEETPGRMQHGQAKHPIRFNIGELYRRENDFIHCIQWTDGLFYVTGTDIVKIVRVIYIGMTRAHRLPAKEI
eukprot:GHVP01016569.1.p1 GENE.GHVP01016569.1~~GHVP01016569.1.p1  ORF type:complete len:139 (-),score=17.22 GHVP01016569.1:1145-1561(-)